ncbi:M50 family metallopeptidase [Pendulispora rubella]|uniref:M50 family metallopeptidase n=1 Tax=Pendulispora rubella TaxID=2741070 RepID=A0ABZ2LCN5_9BACT
MLSFALGSIPIRIHISFWFTAALLGMSRDPIDLIVWILAVLVSVLLHELGHALTGKIFGLAPQIELYAFGGATSWQNGNQLSSWKRVLISLAGPLTGIALGAITFVAVAQSGISPWHLDEWILEAHARNSIKAMAVLSFARSMLWINLLWSLFNLLPILPLDGGNVMAHTFAALSKGGGRRAAHIISAVVAAAIGTGLFVKFGTLYILVILYMGLFSFQNIRALQPANDEAPPPPTRQRW